MIVANIGGTAIGDSAYIFHHVFQGGEVALVFDTASKVAYEASIFTSREYKYFSTGHEEPYRAECLENDPGITVESGSTANATVATEFLK